MLYIILFNYHRPYEAFSIITKLKKSLHISYFCIILERRMKTTLVISLQERDDDMIF